MFKVGDTVRRKQEFLNEAFRHVCKEAQVNPDLGVYTVAWVSSERGSIVLAEADIPYFTWAGHRWEIYELDIEANE